MKLCYRGVKYDYSPTAAEVIDDGDVRGSYRGRPILIHLAHAAFHQHLFAIYRGIAYQY